MERVRLSPLRHHKVRLPLKGTLTNFKESALKEANLDILRTLGRGNYGVVYLVRSGEQQLAVKFFDKTRASEQTIQCAREEARILASIDHPQVVKLHHFEDQKRYLVLYL
jgi:serine/threonine protein kinase